ncbi:MAG: GntR family transcriptional regulator [Syntrophales bacterium]
MKETATQKNTPTREEIYQSLKSAVLSGKYSPGKRLNQKILAEELSVSRTPIREALHRLDLEGLIEQIDDRGFRVASLTRDELEELFDIRSVLEAYTMRFVCRRIQDQSIHKLTECIERSEAALQNRDVEGVFAANTDFHNVFYALIKDKKRFHSMLGNMKDHILKYRKETLFHVDAAKRSIESHKKILLALKTKDPNLTEYLMRIHVQESKEDALRITFGILTEKENTVNDHRLMCMTIE